MSTADKIALASLLVSVVAAVVSVFAWLMSDRASRRANELSGRANELSDKANHLSDKANWLDEKANLLDDKANQLAEKANSISVQIAKRDKIIDLWNAWQGVNDIDVTNASRTIWVDVIRANNALELTASCWNHDAIEKEILFQSYWKDFRNLYDKIKNSSLSFPDGRGPVRNLLTAEVKRAYSEMEQREIAGVKQTNYP